LDASGLTSAESSRPIGGRRPSGEAQSAGPYRRREPIRQLGPCYGWRRAQRIGTFERVKRIEQRANRRARRPDIRPAGYFIVTVGATQCRSQRERERDRPTKQWRRRARVNRGPASRPAGKPNPIAVGEKRNGAAATPRQ
jgi:hypothetical protein